jgi:predicted metalloprotease with PDZ domain
VEVIRAALAIAFFTCISSSYAASPDATPARPYDVEYRAELVPAKGIAAVEIGVSQKRGRLSSAEFSMPSEHYSRISGQGVHVDGERVRWELPREGGTLSFDYKIDHRRASGKFDARITPDWALFRLDDVFPSAKTLARKGAASRARLVVTVPKGWDVETPYGPYDGPQPFDNPERAFDRPTGWLIAGKIGVRRSEIVRRHITIAGPMGQNVRRMDALALLTWTVPTLVAIFPSFPERVLMVTAADDMWRGGLSGPGSFYVHAALPLLSENGTSTILHELVHVATGLHGADGGDWIVEGIAEYYSLEVLRRSQTISQRRFGHAMADLRAWSESADELDTDRSKGPTTARAVGVMHDLDLEIRQVTGSRWTLDHVVRDLIDTGKPVTFARLTKAAEGRIGRPSRVLAAVAPR